MAVEIVHAYSCDGECGQTVMVSADAAGNSDAPKGWRVVDGVVWCGDDECCDKVTKRYRAAVINHARARCLEFETVARRKPNGAIKPAEEAPRLPEEQPA